MLLGLRSNINCPFVLWFFWTVKENFLGTPPTAIRDYFVLTFIRHCLRPDLRKAMFLSYNKRLTTLSIPNWLTIPNKKRWTPLRFGKNTPSKAKYMGKHVKGQKNYANISRIISPSTSVSLNGLPWKS